MAIIPFNSSFFCCCCFPFAVFEHSRVRDFKFLNLFSLSSKFFFARANSSETHATRTTARARFKIRKHAPRTRRKSSTFSLCTRARTLAHTHTHVHCDGGASLPKKERSLFSLQNSLTARGEKVWKKMSSRPSRRNASKTDQAKQKLEQLKQLKETGKKRLDDIDGDEDIANVYDEVRFFGWWVSFSLSLFSFFEK